MGSLGGSDNPSRPERKYPRFKLRYPIRGRFYSEQAVSDFEAVTRNISIGGVLLETVLEIPPHSLVSFAITLRSSHMVHPIELAGEGEVVRVEPAGPGIGFAIAVECKQPIAQIESYLPTDTQ